MGDHNRTEQTLALLARCGAFELLLAMHHRGGTATFAQIAAESPRPAALLRAMAADGFVVSPHAGSLDGEPLAEAHFCLTARGVAVLGHLLRLRHWLASRAAPRPRLAGPDSPVEIY
ncbi:hypothetical protein ACFFMR_29050 [Micromonospora andamanensis]|uniref:Transcriptional regulator n=1 Tax=Micromonospora andamanensis TaxID=1287068 RepID=A0ABQ4I3Z2_9ACTN|nr:hypothetical protein [Micromonospora andamanensis]GIJ12616.1 hypothetical protein Van01_58300 [Micromonospora andamanensis]